MQKTFFRLMTFLVCLFLISSCNNYGKKASQGHVDVYYKDGIQAEQAQKTADLLFNIDKTYNNNTTETKSFQLDKANDTILFKMVVQEDKMGSVEDDSFNAIANMISQSVFNNAPVNVALTDNKFSTKKTIHYSLMDMGEEEKEMEATDTLAPTVQAPGN